MLEVLLQFMFCSLGTNYFKSCFVSIPAVVPGPPLSGPYQGSLPLIINNMRNIRDYISSLLADCAPR